MHVLGLESNDVTLKMTFHGSWKETHEQPGCRRVKGAVVSVLLVVAVVLVAETTSWCESGEGGGKQIRPDRKRRKANSDIEQTRT